MVIEQRSNFGAHDEIVRRGLFQPAQQIARLVFERVLEQISRSSSLLGSHAAGSCGDRRSRGLRGSLKEVTD